VSVGLADGGELDLTSLVHRYGRAIERYISCRTGDEHEAQDLAQETFLRVFRSRDELRNPACLVRWTFRIASNLTIDWRRSLSRWARVSSIHNLVDEEELEITDSHHDPDGEDDLADAARRVVTEVGSLPRDYGVVLALRYLEQLTCPEIAALMRISVANVKVKLFRARNLLRRRLAVSEPELKEHLA
jgi:RNA polymerase sigma-70 factor (ECF subfamily)